MLITRRHGARWGVPVLALGLVVGSAHAAAAAPDPVGHTGTGSTTSVTLITGDRVVVVGDGIGSIVPGRDRGKVAFSHHTTDGHRYVVPEDAMPLIASGKLDQRLFDVTGLISARYDDAHRDTLPLIVTPAPGKTVAGLAGTADLPVVGSFAARTAKATATDSWRALTAAPDDYRRIWLDGLRQPTLDRSTAQIGAPDAWRAGYTGTGVTVAVLDTGVDAAHPDLAGRELAEKNFTEDPDTTDLVGHGTHVAATIASAGAKYRGVAPDSKILDGKVCVTSGCAESAILDGMTWAAEQGADVVNLSLGGQDGPEVDPLEAAVNALSAQYGTLFVIAAGNAGGTETVGSPGSADAALTVGAVDRADKIAPFSSRGPRTGDGAVKPDITAPGVGIVAAKSSTGSIGTPVGEDHVALSGTSMATPHVAGAAALLKQQHPDWTGAQVKAALIASAKPTAGLTAYDQGAGRVDLTRAITQTVTADPVSVGFGTQPWPHEDDRPVTRDVTYRNTGTAPVTLDVALDATGPDGKPAPAGLFTVTPTKVTVPAGGEAKVSVTADTRIGALDGGFSGSVVASSGTTAVRTPVGVVRGIETYTLKLDYTDADGAPATEKSTFLLSLDTGRAYFVSGEEASVSLTLPRGTYFASNRVRTGERNADLPYPKLVLAGDTTVAVDARLAKPVTLTVPDPKAEAIGSMISVNLRYGRGGVGSSSLYLGALDGVSTTHLGPEIPAAEFSASIGTDWHGTPVGDATATYRFTSVFTGKMPTGYVRAPAQRDFAEVRTRIGPAPAGRSGLHGFLGTDANGSGGTWMIEVPTPGTAIDYLAGENVRWATTFSQVVGEGPTLDFETDLFGDARTYQPGKTYREALHTAVFGPSLSSTRSGLSRSGDEIGVSIPAFGDGAGNPGASATDTARTTLFRDGVRVGEIARAGSGVFTVPAAEGSYRLETEATRSGVSDVSTKVGGAWTFRSANQGDVERRLPLSVIRFQPALDEANAAPAGRLLRVPIVVRQNPGADNGKVRRIAVEASFDDGATWHRVPVIGGSALVLNRKAGFASLRAKTTDSRGNTAETTVIRAYKITGR